MGHGIRDSKSFNCPPKIAKNGTEKRKLPSEKVALKTYRNHDNPN